MQYSPIGNYIAEKAGHEEVYFSQRCTTIDYRGELLISKLSYWGYGNTIITASHDISSGEFSDVMIFTKVVVDDYAWITSKCILYNCHIRHHAIISIGSVVNGITVEPYTIVSGNPAIVVAKWDGAKWRRI